ncbi:hypothetical protein J6590_024257 [Homalodisca vitripennis]|nr:hypothetical protein J6590_024257 [Homalodisca vitripennis]
MDRSSLNVKFKRDCVFLDGTLITNAGMMAQLIRERQRAQLADEDRLQVLGTGLCRHCLVAHLILDFTVCSTNSKTCVKLAIDNNTVDLEALEEKSKNSINLLKAVVIQKQKKPLWIYVYNRENFASDHIWTIVTKCVSATEHLV